VAREGVIRTQNKKTKSKSIAIFPLYVLNVSDATTDKNIDNATTDKNLNKDNMLSNNENDSEKLYTSQKMCNS